MEWMPDQFRVRAPVGATESDTCLDDLDRVGYTAVKMRARFEGDAVALELCAEPQIVAAIEGLRLGRPIG